MVLWCAITLHTHFHVLPEAIPLTCWKYCSLLTLLPRSRCPPSFPQSHFSRTQEKKRLAYVACWRRKSQMLLVSKIGKNTYLGQSLASDLHTTTRKPFVQPVWMQREQFLCMSSHPARRFIASTIAGEWLLRSHTAFSWPANHFVKAFYCPLTP